MTVRMLPIPFATSVVVSKSILQSQAAAEGWLRYFVETEEFDRTLDGSPSPRCPDEWMPAPWERHRSLQFAREAMSRLEAKLKAAEVDAGQNQRVKERWLRARFKAWVDELRVLETELSNPFRLALIKHGASLIEDGWSLALHASSDDVEKRFELSIRGVHEGNAPGRNRLVSPHKLVEVLFPMPFLFEAVFDEAIKHLISNLAYEPR
jgi:hypothetical protein